MLFGTSISRTGAEEMLKDEEKEFTVFCPDDDAMGKFAKEMGVTKLSLYDLEGLPEMVKDHIVEGKFAMADLPDEITTLSGKTVPTPKVVLNRGQGKKQVGGRVRPRRARGRGGLTWPPRTAVGQLQLHQRLLPHHRHLHQGLSAARRAARPRAHVSPHGIQIFLSISGRHCPRRRCGSRRALVPGRRRGTGRAGSGRAPRKRSRPRCFPRGDLGERKRDVEREKGKKVIIVKQKKVLGQGP